MKPFVFHRPSFLLGLALAGVGVLIAAQTATPSSQPRCGWCADPRDMVQIIEGQPYEVPTGKVFVLTALGDAVAPGSTTLAVGDVAQASVLYSYAEGLRGSTIMDMPPGFTAPAGSKISILKRGENRQGRAWGYLVNAK